MLRAFQIALVLFAVLAPWKSNAAPPADYLTTICAFAAPPGFRPAERIGDMTPTYPRSALNRWSEGWVEIEFDVTADGAVANPYVTDTTGARDFVRAAMAAVARQRFRPATRNGTAVAQYLRQASIVFRYSDSAPVAEHPGFIENYKSAKRALEDNEPDEALRYLDRAFGGRLNLYEVSLGSYLLAVAYEQKKEWARVRHYIEQAVREDTKYLDRDTAVAVRELLFTARVETGDAAAAVCAFNWLATKSRPALEPRYQEVRARLLADAPLVASARLEKHPNLSDPPMWRRKLVRRKFSFADVSGDVTSVRLACVDSVKEAPIASQPVWLVPEQGGTCFVKVVGAPGTTFKIREEW